jgi:hypothetical protein
MAIKSPAQYAINLDQFGLVLDLLAVARAAESAATNRIRIDPANPFYFERSRAKRMFAGTTSTPALGVIHNKSQWEP